MKKLLLSWRGVAAVLLILLLWGCFKEPDGYSPSNPSRPQNLTLERARATHEAACEYATRSESEFGVLYSGSLDLWWDGAQYSESFAAESYDVEAVAETYYQQVHYLPDSTAVLSTVYPRVVVVEERLRERNPASYVAFYFPDRLTEENYEQDAGEGLLNSLPKEGFSGVIVYTTLKGFPVAASRHAEGRQLDQAFLGDATDYPSLVEKAEHYNRIVENIRIFVGEGTRSVAEDDVDGGDVPLVIVTVSPVVRLPKLENPVTDPNPIDLEVTEPSSPTTGGEPIGDSNKKSSLEDGKYDKNENIRTTSELVAEILDALYTDCMGKTLIDAIGTTITIVVDSDPKKNSYDKSTGVIKFGDGGEDGKQRGYVLLEELIHAYQREHVADQAYEAAKLNYEIEAKVGWLMYEKRRLASELEFDQYDLELGSTFFFEELIKTCYPNYDQNNALHKINYDMIISILRPIYPRADYPEFNDSRTFENLEELMKNC